MDKFFNSFFIDLEQVFLVVMGNINSGLMMTIECSARDVSRFSNLFRDGVFAKLIVGDQDGLFSLFKVFVGHFLLC